jgi:hypothetical protein
MWCQPWVPPAFLTGLTIGSTVDSGASRGTEDPNDHEERVGPGAAACPVQPIVCIACPVSDRSPGRRHRAGRGPVSIGRTIVTPVKLAGPPAT